jgi:hypothetical protein
MPLRKFRISVLLSCLVFVLIMLSVDQKMVHKSDLDIQTSLIKKRPKIKKDKPEAFAKVHNLVRSRIGESSSRYPLNYQFDEFRKAQKRLDDSGLRNSDNLSWEERGPGNVGGRTRSIVLDSRDESFNTWYVGAVGGGIWKTQDAGNSWRNLT